MPTLGFDPAIRSAVGARSCRSAGHLQRRRPLTGDYQFELDVTDSLGLKGAAAFASVTADSCSLNAPVVSSFTTQTATQFQATAFTFPDPSTHVTNNNCP